MNIAVDLDGCLVDFNTGFSKLLMRIEPQTKVDFLAPDYPAVWNYPKYYGFSAETESKAWTEVKNSGLFWRALFPYASAYEDLKFLDSIRNNHDIYFVTSRPGKGAKRQTEEWLREYGFDKATVIICHNKQPFCEAVEIDLIVDDRPENLQDLSGKIKRAMFKRPYNKDWWGFFEQTVTSVREAFDALS